MLVVLSLHFTITSIIKCPNKRLTIINSETILKDQLFTNTALTLLKDQLFTNTALTILKDQLFTNTALTILKDFV